MPPGEKRLIHSLRIHALNTKFLRKESSKKVSRDIFFSLNFRLQATSQNVIFQQKITKIQGEDVIDKELKTLS